MCNISHNCIYIHTYANAHSPTKTAPILRTNHSNTQINAHNIQYKVDSTNKSEFDKLRAIEAEESKLFESMIKQSDIDKRARVDAEIAF